MVGSGVYNLSEVSKFTGVPITTLRSWFLPRSDNRGQGPIFQSDYDPIDGDYAISFLNMIEAYVARFFKNEGVKPKDIRAARQVIKQEFSTDYPIAHRDLGTHGGTIIRRTKNQELIGVVCKQRFFEQMQLERMVHGDRDLVDQWMIAKGVTISPTVHFGKPVVENTGVSTLVVARQYVANSRNAALVARLFKLTRDGVTNAYQFEHGLGRVAA